jgi:GntR family transcriptional regulator
MRLAIDTHSQAPPSQQLRDAILDAIACEELRPGDALPSVRAAAAQALVNPNTVSKAWRELEWLGAVEGRNGSGVFVTSTAPKVARRLRRDETLELFERATLAALRAGASTAELARRIEAHAHEAGAGRKR